MPSTISMPLGLLLHRLDPAEKSWFLSCQEKHLIIYVHLFEIFGLRYLSASWFFNLFFWVCFNVVEGLRQINNQQIYSKPAFSDPFH
jgi:hypothetical protein